MIYMRGLKAKDLESIVDFIYFGEANLFQEDVDSFLTLADKLQLKGVAQSGDESPVNMSDANQKPFQNHFKQLGSFNMFVSRAICYTYLLTILYYAANK